MWLWSGASGATDVGGRRSERNGGAAPGTEREGKPQPTTYAFDQPFPDRRSASGGGGRDDSLATAPWNRLSNPAPNGFRAVGGALLRFARFRSEELDYGGLVGLHSLPTAEAFYRKMGMIDGGVDAEKENLTYFEWYRRDSSVVAESGIDKDIELDD